MKNVHDPYSRSTQHFQDSPQGIKATLKQVGPGMILVGGVVGSGELIVTTKLGALAGFIMLWFVIFSCVIKVMVQTELARYTICSGKTYLQIFNEMPGPSSFRPRWLTLSWMAVVLVSFVLALMFHLKVNEESHSWLRTVAIGVGFCATLVVSAWIIRNKPQESQDGSDSQGRINWFMWVWLISMLLMFINTGAILGGAGQSLELAFPNLLGAYGSRIWAIIIAFVVAGLLLSGTYRPLENVLTVMVITFTVLTIVCTFLLQTTEYAVSWNDIKEGLSFGIPLPMTAALLLAALAMYAGTGVAYGEIAGYTYWCVEKGYARNTGEIQPGEAWAKRAKGWIRVMYTDALLTMVVYTSSTICFFILGAAVLHVNGLNPDGSSTLSTLSNIYTESLGSWSATLFIIGAFFVLFSTVLAGVASVSRMLADALGVIGVKQFSDYNARLRFIRVFVIVALVMYSTAFWLFQNPPQMLIITSSILAAIFYPTLGVGVLYLRHRKVDKRVLPGRPATILLWICGIMLTIVSPGGIILTFLINYNVISFGN